MYYVSDSVNQGLSTAVYGNLQQSTAICSSLRQSAAVYGSLRQSTAIYGNLRQFACTCNTTWYYHNLYRNSKDGREEKCVYGFSNCIVVGYQFFTFSKVLLVSLEYIVLKYASPDASLIWVRGNTQRTIFPITCRS